MSRYAGSSTVSEGWEKTTISVRTSSFSPNLSSKSLAASPASPDASNSTSVFASIAEQAPRATTTMSTQAMATPLRWRALHMAMREVKDWPWGAEVVISLCPFHRLEVEVDELAALDPTHLDADLRPLTYAVAVLIEGDGSRDALQLGRSHSGL